jgi:hypothetical protein
LLYLRFAQQLHAGVLADIQRLIESRFAVVLKNPCGYHQGK